MRDADLVVTQHRRQVHLRHKHLLAVGDLLVVAVGADPARLGPGVVRDPGQQLAVEVVLAVRFAIDACRT